MIGGIDYRPFPGNGFKVARAWIERLRRAAFAERRRERARLGVWENEGGALFAARRALRDAGDPSHYAC